MQNWLEQDLKIKHQNNSYFHLESIQLCTLKTSDFSDIQHKENIKFVIHIL